MAKTEIVQAIFYVCIVTNQVQSVLSHMVNMK
jgi:hypothetical protein